MVLKKFSASRLLEGDGEFLSFIKLDGIAGSGEKIVGREYEQSIFSPIDGNVWTEWFRNRDHRYGK